MPLGKSLLAALALAFFLSTSPASAQPQQPAQSGAPAAAAEPKQDKAKYDDLLAKLKKGDRATDFQALRYSYAETDKYNPYGGDREARKAMFAAINGRDWDKALEQSRKVLDGNYLDISGHFGAYVANREKGKADEADFHKYVFEGLLDSIRNSGDGTSAEKAFVVISTDEEYALLNFMGLRPSGQSLVNSDGHSYDLMRAVDPKTNREVQLFFNIDKPFGWLGKSLKK